MVMTAINYPAQLPAPQWGDNGYSVVSPNLRTNMENGRAMQRRKFSSVPVMRQASWVFKGGEGALFELWYKEVLKDGTEWFNVYLRHPEGFRPFVCRMVDVYQGPTAWGANRWRYSATLEIWERPIISSDWLILPDYIAGSDIFDIAMNVKMPAA